MTRRSLLVAALVVLGRVLPAPAAEPAPVSAPFEILEKGELLSGHMALQVKINGKGPYRMIFDTGAPITLMNNKIAKEADVTVVYYVDRKVASNHAFRAGQLRDGDVARVASEVKTILPK